MPPDRGGKVSSVQTRARHSFPNQLVVGLHESVSSLVLIEQGTEFREDAGLPFRHQDLDLSGFLVDLEILDQPKRLAPPLILHQDPERQLDVRLHARPRRIQFSGERVRLRRLKSQKILQFLVKPHGMLTSRIVLILLKYDPLIPRVPWGFRHSSGCKMGSAGDKVDEPSRLALVRRDGVTAAVGRGSKK